MMRARRACARSSWTAKPMPNRNANSGKHLLRTRTSTRSASMARGPDVLAIAAAVILPAGMATWPSIGGVLQRLMFFIAYVWYAVEAVRTLVPAGETARRIEAQ